MPVQDIEWVGSEFVYSWLQVEEIKFLGEGGTAEVLVGFEIKHGGW